MPDYSYPQWLIPRHAPWEALVAGVSAGAQIAANNQRGRALAAQMDHQAFQERVLQSKADADAQDLKTLQEWWPTFTAAQGEGLSGLQVPPLKNAQLWNNITMEVERKKQQSGAGELANAIAAFTSNPTPQGEAAVWGIAAKNPWIGIDKVGAQMDQIKTANQKAKDASETARYHDLMAGKTPQKVNLAEAQRLERIADALEPVDADEAKRYRDDANVMRASIPTAAGVVGDVSKPTTSTKSQIQQRMLSSDKTLEMGAELLGSLTSSDVGVRGAINQVVVNEGLAQIFPSLYKGNVTDARTLLGVFNENAIKAIASDPRISDKDRQRYESILPSLGKVETVQSAKDKIRVFMQKFRDQTRTDAKSAGIPVPDWALTVDELKSKIEADPSFAEQAVEIMKRYH